MERNNIINKEKFCTAISWIKKLSLLLFLTASLTACDDFKAPIEADDFGFPKVTIFAKGKNVQGQQQNELSEWVFSGYAYNGSPAVIMVYNIDYNNYNYCWSSWFGAGEPTLSSAMQSRSTPLCCIGGSYDVNTGSCSNQQYCVTSSGKSNTSGIFENVVNAPCIFTGGQGLYLLLTDPANSVTKDPNTYPSINRNPASANFFTLAMWQYTGMYNNNVPANGYNQSLITNNTLGAGSSGNPVATYTNINITNNYINGKAYFKILDRYYDDNSGFYQVSLKNGFSSVVTPPIAKVLNTVTYALQAASQIVFNNLIKESGYRNALRAAITIYIIVSGILFLGGVLPFSQAEIINRMIKLIIVIQLLTTETSWWVFNNYFFQFFTNGINEIINIITANVSGSYNSSGAQGITFFDDMLGLLFSYETSMKIVALIFSIKAGIPALILIYIAFIIFVVALAKGLILYLLAYIATSILIALGPVFITFMLFGPTRSLFDQWINLLVLYFFQPMLVFASLAMMGQNVISSMYRILGYKVCYSPWLVVANNTIMKMWQICSTLKHKDVIAVPGFGFWNPQLPNRLYVPYEYQDQRYIDLPFLTPSGPTGTYDQPYIEAFNSPYTDLNNPILFNSFILLLTTGLMNTFHNLVPDLAKGLVTGDSQGGVNLGGAASSAVSDIRKRN
jgi:type IV secretion system protein VirB6